MNRVYMSGIVIEEPIHTETPEGAGCTFLLANENGTYRVNAADDEICCGDEIRLAGRLSQRCVSLGGTQITCTEINAEEMEPMTDGGCLYPALASFFETTICQKLLAVLFLALLIRFTGDE